MATAIFNQTTKEFTVREPGHPIEARRTELGNLGDIGAPVTPALLDRLLTSSGFERTGDWVEKKHPFVGLSFIYTFEAPVIGA